MTSQFEDLVRELAQRLTREQDVDAGLERILDAVAAAAAAKGPTSGAQAAQEALRKRSAALDAAAEQVDRLRARVEYLAAVLPFTDEGWPERQRQLEAELTTDAAGGVASWLADWFAAAGRGRLDALGRLLVMKGLPAGARTLVEHCSTATDGFGERPRWFAVHRVLDAGARGVRFGDRTVPDDDVRTALRLLDVRLLLDDAEAEPAGPRRDHLLAAAEAALANGAASATAGAEALRARRDRLADEPESELQHLKHATAEASFDLDVAVSRIEAARADDRYDVALDAARAAVSAFPVVAEAEWELRRLVVTPPAELWAAVAERALEEGEFQVYGTAVTRAQDLAPAYAYPLVASIAELVVEGYEKQDSELDDHATALVAAGADRAFAGQLELAVPHFERALALVPGHQEASLRLADCLVTLAAAKPLAAARAQLERALELLADGSELAREDDFAWSYQSASSAHVQLGAGVEPARDLHLWQALGAACRALAHDLQSSFRWIDLTNAAHSLSLYAVCEVTARRSVALAPADEMALSQQLQAHMDAGRLDDALAMLALMTEDTWATAVRAHVELRRGNATETVRLLQRAELDPSWSWAVRTVVTALDMVGDHDEAARQAELACAAWEGRLDEVEALWTVGWLSATTLGDFERAAELAGRLASYSVEGEVESLRAMAALVRGDPKGVPDLVRSIELSRSIFDLLSIEHNWIPQAAALASSRGAGLPPLDGVAEALARRRTELEAPADPIAELRDAADRTTEPDTVAVAKAMCTALVCLSRPDPAAASRALEPALKTNPDDTELQRLASAALASDQVLRSGQAGAESAAEESPPDETPTERPLEAVMPPSWFEEYDDPLNEHPLFLHYLPELRTRASIPPVNVLTDVELEPDGYVIRVLDTIVEEGRVGRDSVYALPDALDLLGAELRASATLDENLGLMRIPRSAAADGDALVGLLSLEPEELVCRRLAELALTHADRLAAAVAESS